MQGPPQTMEQWRSAAILLAQCHYTHFNVRCFVAGEGGERPSVRPPPPGPTIAGEGDKRASVCLSVRPPSDDSDRLFSGFRLLTFLSVRKSKKNIFETLCG